MKVDMVDYVTDMVKDFPDNLPKKKVMCPWTDKMFCIDENSKPFNRKISMIFPLVSCCSCVNKPSSS